MVWKLQQSILGEYGGGTAYISKNAVLSRGLITPCPIFSVHSIKMDVHVIWLWFGLNIMIRLGSPVLVLPMRLLYISWTSGTPRACEGGQKFSCMYKSLIGTFLSMRNMANENMPNNSDMIVPKIIWQRINSPWWWLQETTILEVVLHSVRSKSRDYWKHICWAQRVVEMKGWWNRVLEWSSSRL